MMKRRAQNLATDKGITLTAHVKSLPNSPDAPVRQQTYLRAPLS